MIKRIYIGKPTEKVAVALCVTNWCPEHRVHPSDLEKVVADLESSQDDHTVFTYSPLLLNYIEDLSKIFVCFENGRVYPIAHKHPAIVELLEFSAIGELWANLGDDYLVEPEPEYEADPELIPDV